jgi:thiazole/oxazole-forming peptide maturase SagD family component
MPELTTTLADGLRVDEAAMQIIRRLQDRMHSPLCGLTTTMGFLLGPRRGPGFFCVGGDMTGVHVLQGQEPPRMGSYHIGGSGIRPYEALIRTLGETAERYSGYAAAVGGKFAVEWASQNELTRRGEKVLGAEAFQLFRPEQLSRQGFPFVAFDPDASMAWVRMEELTGSGPCLVPAQFILVGHVIHSHGEEPWLQTAVSTGTAVHGTYARALIGALQEVVQIDSSIGHWHGAGAAQRIQFDQRTRAFENMLAERIPEGGYTTEFHLLPNADLPGLSVACLLREPAGRVPVLSIGLGSDSTLTGAMYKALLEAVGVCSLATWTLIDDVIAGLRDVDTAPDLNSIFNLETNVGYYATPVGVDIAEHRFGSSVPMAASDLPPDDRRSVQERVRTLVEAFSSTGKSLYYGDFTGPDLRGLRLPSVRVWSPDTLGLPLPSAPPMAHPRFDAYGGFLNDEPHPYP